MVRCHTQLLPSPVIIVDLASDQNAWREKYLKTFSPGPAAGTVGGDSREADMRGFAYDTWPGRTGRSEGELPEAAPLSTPIEQHLIRYLFIPHLVIYAGLVWKKRK